MYKYVKGITVLSEEKMPNALEIAKEYHLWMPLTDSLTPNGALIEFLVEAFIERNNYKTSEYFYIDPYKVSFPVYPRKFITMVMDEFMQFLNDNNMISTKEKIYAINNIEFMYYEEPRPECKIINLTEFRKRKEGKKND